MKKEGSAISARPAIRRRTGSAIPPLLRDRAFRRYWSGQSVSMFGDQISSIVLPLVAVLALHASPAQMGLLVALEWLPSLLFALHVGAWVDRHGHRRATMIAADLGRAALLASIPVCAAIGVLTVWQLYGVAFGTGTLSVLFTVCDPRSSSRWCPAIATWKETRWSTAAGRCLSSAARASAGCSWTC